MIDRQMVGDVALAILLVLPTTALARLEPARAPNPWPIPASVAPAADSNAPATGRLSLLG